MRTYSASIHQIVLHRMIEVSGVHIRGRTEMRNCIISRHFPWFTVTRKLCCPISFYEGKSLYLIKSLLSLFLVDSSSHNSNPWNYSLQLPELKLFQFQFFTKLTMVPFFKKKKKIGRYIQHRINGILFQLIDGEI